MLCLRSTYRQLQDDLQLYYPVCLWNSSLHSAVSRETKADGPIGTVTHVSYLTTLLSLSVAPYSISPSLFILTGYRVYVFVNCVFFEEVGKLFTRVSSSRRVLNALDRWHVLIGFSSDKGVASSSAPFYPIYK